MMSECDDLQDRYEETLDAAKRYLILAIETGWRAAYGDVSSMSRDDIARHLRRAWTILHGLLKNPEGG